MCAATTERRFELPAGDLPEANCTVTVCSGQRVASWVERQASDGSALVHRERSQQRAAGVKQIDRPALDGGSDEMAGWAERDLLGPFCEASQWFAEWMDDWKVPRRDRPVGTSRREHLAV